MQSGWMPEKVLGYAQAAAGAINSATLISSLTFQGQSSPGIPRGTVLLLIQPVTAAIRWRDDGTAPTTAVGYPLAANAELRYTAQGFAAIQVIGTGAELNVVAYGNP